MASNVLAAVAISPPLRIIIGQWPPACELMGHGWLLQRNELPLCLSTSMDSCVAAITPRTKLALLGTHPTGTFAIHWLLGEFQVYATNNVS